MDFPVSRPLGIIQRIFYDTHDDSPSIILAVSRTTINLGEVRSVRQPSKRLEDHVLHDPHQQFVPQMQAFPGGVAEEAPILQQQRIAGELRVQLLGQRSFRILPAADYQTDFGVAAHLDQRHFTHLWKSRVATTTTRPTEDLIRVAVRNVIYRSIHRHQAMASIERTGSVGCRQRLGHTPNNSIRGSTPNRSRPAHNADRQGARSPARSGTTNERLAESARA